MKARGLTRVWMNATGLLHYLGCLLSLTLCGLAQAQTPIEHSAEWRLQIDFHVPDAALAALLPAGWEPQIATAGAAKDANVRLIFVDRLEVSAPDGKPVGRGQSRLAYLAVPVRRQGSDETGQMIVAGLTDQAVDVPGAFGTLRLATQVSMQRATDVDAAGVAHTREDWLLLGEAGERLEIHARYERGVVRRGTTTTRFYSPQDPNQVQVFKVESGIDIMRNATVPVRDRVSEMRYVASGGRFSALFDGSERVLSIDAFPWYDRLILKP